MDCISCTKPEQEQALIFDTPQWKVVLADDQAYLGRCVIILKRHCGILAEMWPAEWQDFVRVVKRLETTLRSRLRASL